MKSNLVRNIGFLLLAGIILVLIFLFVRQQNLANKNASQNSTQNNNKFQVVASFYPLYFFSSQIGADLANVINITPPAAEPHEYEPTARDITDIISSRLLVLNGNFEPWAERVLKNINLNKTVVVKAGSGLNDLNDLNATNSINTNPNNLENARIDPHTWLSPVLAGQMVTAIASGFLEADPNPIHDQEYISNAAKLKERLVNLDSEYKTGLANCFSRDIVTSHAAFGQLAAAYNLNQISIAGLSPNAEPSPRQLADLAEYVRTNKIKIIFFETLVSPKLAESLASETGVQTAILNPLEGLTVQEITDGADYFSVMQQNLATLQKALDCK